MKRARILIFIILSILLILVLAGLGLDWWIEKRLPQIINRENDSPYQIKYKDIDVSLIGRSVTVTDISVVPKTSLATEAKKEGLYINVPTVDISGINIYDILFTDRIRAHSLTISKPDITFIQDKNHKKRNARHVKKEVVDPFTKIIYVSGFTLKDADIRIIQTDSTPVLTAKNLWLQVDDIVVTDNTLEEKIPFRFSDYNWSCDTLYYRAGIRYDIAAGHLSNSKRSLLIKNFHLKPRLSKSDFTKSLATEKDRYDVSAASIQADSLDWGFNDDTLFVNAKSLALHQADANIFRSKTVADDLTRKKLYSEMLRTLKHDIRVNQLKLIDSRIQYEEEKDAESGAGKVFFTNFYLTAHNVRSGLNQKSLPDVDIDVKCRLMGTAPMEVNWSFNVLNPSDKFNIRGRVFNFPAERLATFSKPYMNAVFKGDLEEIYFNFTGNRDRMGGDFALNYDKLKVTVYKKKDRKKKNALVTALANLMVKDSSKDKVKGTKVDVERIKEKSFFNLLWRGVQEGLKEIIT